MMRQAGDLARQVELSHGTTNYLEAGSGPPVILLHGAGFELGGNSWAGNLPLLAGRFRVLAPDCLGWGAGGQLEQGYSFAYLVDFVREFQDALGLPRSHIVGHSMGGWIASLLAYESPNRVDRLVLIASGGMATRRLQGMVGWRPPDEEHMRQMLRPLRDLDVDVDAMVARALELGRDPERTARFGRIMVHMTDPETRARYHMARRLPLISAPTLIVWGSADPVNPLELGTATHELIPNSRLRVFEGCGHAPHWERPQEVGQAILEFLEP